MMDSDKKLIRQQLHDLIDYLLDVNDMTARSRSSTGTLPTIFFEYSGHINGFAARLYRDGWMSGANYDRGWNFYLDKPISQEIIDSFHVACDQALTDKTESDVLKADIARKEAQIQSEKDSLKKIKRELKKMERRAQ